MKGTLPIYPLFSLDTMPLLKNHSVILVIIFVVSLGLFTVGLNASEIIGFESRFYLFALEMLKHGVGWFPTTYFQPYPDYPVTPTLMIVAMAKVFGGLTKFTAVLPSALAASATLCLTYSTAALHHKSWGIASVLFMLLTYLFLMEARTISPDQFVAFATVGCFYVAYRAEYFKKTAGAYWIPLLLMFGFSCRGPIGLVIPAGVLTGFYCFSGRFTKMIYWGAVSAILLVLCCGLLFFAAYQTGGMPFVKTVWHMQVAGRLEDAYLPAYFYLTESFGAYAITYPLVVFALVGVMAANKHEPSAELKLVKQLIGWVLIIIIGLSIPAIKKPRYILAMAPALSMICAYILLMQHRTRYLAYLQKALKLLLVFFPCLAFCMLMIAYTAMLTSKTYLPIPFFTLGLLCIAAQIVNALLWMKQDRTQLLILSVAACIFVVSYLEVVELVNEFTNQTRQFVTSVESARHAEHAKLIIYKENPDGLPIKYLVNTARTDEPLFINTPEALIACNEKAWVLITQEHSNEFTGLLKRFKFIRFGYIGRIPVTIMTKLDAKN
jgi:4-amino-4-deoxy-L-arabinose transferase-like glycosyltransferase